MNKMNIALWVLQVLMGGMFIMAGGTKTFVPVEELVIQMPWVGDVPSILVRFIGISELAGGIGLLLPALTRILPWLTPVAGAALALVMVLAAGFHLMRGEFGAIGINLVLIIILGAVAYGRWKVEPILPRGES